MHGLSPVCLFRFILSIAKPGDVTDLYLQTRPNDFLKSSLVAAERFLSILVANFLLRFASAWSVLSLRSFLQN